MRKLKIREVQSFAKVTSLFSDKFYFSIRSNSPRVVESHCVGPVAAPLFPWQRVLSLSVAGSSG